MIRCIYNRIWYGDDMNNKFYLVVFCILSCSVLLLGMSYSKDSTDHVDTGLIEISNDSYRAVYSMDKNIDTKDNNKLRVSLINKKNTDTNYALYLREESNKELIDIYYSINGGEEYLLTDNVISLGNLSEYGTDGDTYIFDITLRSVEDYSFYYSIGEVSYGS